MYENVTAQPRCGEFSDIVVIHNSYDLPVIPNGLDCTLLHSQGLLVF